MFTTIEHTTIVTLLAAGKPVWYVAAVTKAHAHDVYAVGASYGYPDRTRLGRRSRT
jgi:lactam utilization protein B